MNDSNLSRITEPLLELANQSPADCFSVVVRVVVVAGADPKAAYANVPAILQQVATAIATLPLDSAKHEGMTASGAATGSPFLYATLTGANVLALEQAIPAGVPLEFRRDRTTLDQSAGFDPEDLVGRVIAEPLASQVASAPDASYDIIVVLNTGNPQGVASARKAVADYLDLLGARAGTKIDYAENDNASHPYVYATMSGFQIRALVELDRNPGTGPISIHQIWEDSHVQPLITKSIATVKADAAHVAFSALGKGIVWAVLDSGIDVTHPHFAANQNLKLDDLRPLRHRDFTAPPDPKADPAGDDQSALRDAFGHGTHVAGIIAGSWTAPTAAKQTAQDPRS